MAMKTWQILAIVAAVILVFNPMGLRDTITGAIPSGDGPDAPAERCYVEDTTLLLGPAEQLYDPGNKLTTSYHQVFVNGVNEGEKLDSSTMTVTPGDEICVVYAINDSVTQQYANKQCFTVPCKGRISTGASKDSDAYKLCKIDVGLTTRIFNKDDGQLNSLTTNDTVAAGAKNSLKMEIQGTYERCWSPMGNQVVVFDINSSMWDDVSLGNYAVAPLPFQHSNAHHSIDGKQFAYSLPGVTSNEEITTTLNLDADDTNNPGGRHSVINITFYDSDYFINDLGQPEIGVENSTDNDVGGTNQKARYYPD